MWNPVAAWLAAAPLAAAEVPAGSMRSGAGGRDVALSRASAYDEAARLALSSDGDDSDDDDGRGSRRRSRSRRARTRSSGRHRRSDSDEFRAVKLAREEEARRAHYECPVQ
jgi:hypothetical protein